MTWESSFYLAITLWKIKNKRIESAYEIMRANAACEDELARGTDGPLTSKGERRLREAIASGDLDDFLENQAVVDRLMAKG
jgi:hypothetical protein